MNKRHKRHCPHCATPLTQCPIGDRSLICEPCIQRNLVERFRLREQLRRPSLQIC